MLNTKPTTQVKTIALASMLAVSVPGVTDPENFETSFEFTDSSFVIGQSPLTARFTGGEAKATSDAEFARTGSNAWHVPSAGTATMTFDTPAERVEIWFRDQPGAARSFVEVFDTANVLINARDGSQAYQRFSVSRLGEKSKISRVVIRSAGGNDTVVDDVSFTINDEPVTDNIIGRLEEPVNGQTHGGVGNLRGWVIAPGGIERVDIFIDGEFQFTAPYGGSRPDVQDSYPDIPGSDASGFSLAYGYSNLLPGEHTAVARVFTNDGQQADFTSSFTVVGFEKPFINATDEVDVGITTYSGAGDEVTMRNVSIAGRLYDLKLRWRTAEQGFEIVEIQ